MRLQQAWYKAQNQQPLYVYLLLPFMALFWAISAFRRLLYRYKILKQYKSKLPVIVVGNISVGGNGKTPVVLALLDYFNEQGIKCAVLSRGYGGSKADFPYLLKTGDSAAVVGDEPALIFARAKVPVVIDPKRARGAQFIEQLSNVQVIICDDGMQHYALARDIELCVMDGRGIGNGYLLPMGPLRESYHRLNSVDWLIYNGSNIEQQAVLKKAQVNVSEMTLKPTAWVNIKSASELDIEEGLEKFKALSISALAGIGDPKRFFDTLSGLGIKLKQTKALADHHAIAPSDLPVDEIVLMTEKDAVKCSAFASEHCWYLKVDAQLPQAFYDKLQQSIVAKIRKQTSHIK